MDEAPYAPPSADLREARTGFRAIWLLWGCGGLVVLLLLALGSCFVVAKGAMGVGEKEFGPACAQYLEKWEASDYPAAYAQLGEEGKKAMSPERHTAIMTAVHEKLGAVVTREVQFVQTGVNQNGRWGEIVYKAKFTKGEGTIKFSLRKEGDRYKVVGIFFQSPVFQEVLDKALTGAK